MRRISVSLAALFLILGMSLSQASAEMYVSGNLGTVFLEDADVDADGENIGFSFDNGVGGTVGLGHEYGNGLRTEIELGYRGNDIDELEDDGFSGSLDGDVTALSAMLDVYYDFIPNSVFTPFIGAGIGVANVEVDLEDFGSDDDNVFAYQLMAGGSFRMGKRLNLDLQYRYFATDDHDFTITDIESESEYATHNIMLGLRCRF